MTGPDPIDYQAITPFRRATEIVGIDRQLATAEVEDDHHHFRVEVEARDGVIARVSGTAVRRPWTMCALAVAELQKLVGAPLSEDPTAVLGYANIRLQCTHLFDLAGLAVAALGRGQVGLRRYDMTVTPLSEGRWRAEIDRDDGLRHDWTVLLGEIAEPEALAGKSLKAPFSDWARSWFDADGFEAALLLRRAIFVGKFRHLFDLDKRESAAEGRYNIGGCFVLQPGRVADAKRIKGATTSFPLEGPGPLARDHN